MAELPDNTKSTKYLIEMAQPPQKQKRRTYLGMSGLAAECERVPWFGFRWAKEKYINTRSRRIFDRGDIEEARIISELVAAGMRVYAIIDGQEVDLTGEIGERQEELVGYAGHAKGHPDGRILGLVEAPNTVHLLEIKTMNQKYWDNFFKLGIKKSHPVYYGQMQRYMDKMGLERAIIIATNKNTEERHYERVKFDKDYAQELAAKEEDLILYEEPPVRMFNRNWWKCKTCNFFDICHDDAAPNENCRTCIHVELGIGGTWMCGLNNSKELSPSEQEEMTLCKGKSYKRLF